MARETLLDYFIDFARWPGEFLVHDDGYRVRSYTYADVARAARGWTARLRNERIGKSDKVIFWSENRPEWVMALWGCLLEGVIVVPIDYRASPELLRRVERMVEARAVLVGDDVAALDRSGPAAVWTMAGVTESRLAPVPNLEAGAPPIGRDDIAEIVFTSGATADPKGVVITHRNILANVVPVEREIIKYRKYGWPFFPIRFLNLLPLSHMFGQAMTAFIPPLLPGVVLFIRGYNPTEIVRQIKSRRISVLVCVPKILDVLKDYVVRLVPAAENAPPAQEHWMRRWWRYRQVHRLFGWKFWCIVVGAAPLDPDLEEFWSRLGFIVVQGYGLTETAPIVTLNHPFKARKGTVGTPIAGVEVRIAPDGEILVRGENVTRGYYEAERETAEAFENGWFHTGDVGSVDEAGRLSVRGRKKEMIVTPEGLNVFPEDVERVLDAIPGVKESAVVGAVNSGQERVHAVLVLSPGTGPEEVIRTANAQLEDHQKVRGVSVWPADRLPRTEGTRKLKRRELRHWVAGERPAGGTSPGPDQTVEAVVAQFAPGRSVTSQTTLDELGLTSLERLELMMALEDRFQVTIDEAAFASAATVEDLRAIVERPELAMSPGPRTLVAEPIEFPAWNRSALARTIRRLSLPTWILPLQRVFARVRVEGLEHLRDLEGPVVFAANHQSHMDTPVILSALPPQWRYRVAPAMAKEFFRAHFFPAQHTRTQWLTNSLNYFLAALFFNAFPLPQREAGTRQTLRYIGELIDEGHSILIFPEGKRTDRGEINRFQAGIGMIGSRLEVPVVPVRIEGLDHVLHQSWKSPRPGPVRIAIGAPMRLKGDDYPALAREVEAAVRGL